MAASVALNLRHLRVFQAVAINHSVSRASLQSGVSQPAVTQALAKLETIFGVSLFRRSHSGCYPTEFGGILLARVERHLAEIEQAILHAQPNVVRARCIASKITGTHVRCAVRIAEHGSVEPAAAALGISVAALSRVARDLEKIVGRELFHRGAHGVMLSATGAEIARRFELAIREVDLASEEIASAKGFSTASIRIGALPLFPKHLIMTSLSELKARHPGTRIKFAEGAYLSLLSDLRSGRVDFLFSVLRLPDWVSDVREEALLQDPFVVVARRDHPLTRARKLTLEDLARFEWVMPQPGTPRRAAFDQMFAHLKMRPGIAVETRSLDFQQCVLESSDCLSLVTRQQSSTEAGPHELSVVPYAMSNGRPADGVAVRSDWRPTTVQAAFLDLIRQNAQRMFPAGPARFARRTGLDAVELAPRERERGGMRGRATRRKRGAVVVLSAAE